MRWVAVETAPLGIAIAKATREIDFLREFRTRLIADVVTGKLDVREAAASLPVETEEPEAPKETDSLAEGEEAPEDAELETAAAEARDEG